MVNMFEWNVCVRMMTGWIKGNVLVEEEFEFQMYVISSIDGRAMRISN